MPTTFESFRSSLSGEVVRPGEAEYERGIRRWSDSVAQPAQYVVFVKTNEDVTTTIRFARENKLEIAICGGGHSWSGASSTTGLVIHLGKYMNKARCDPEKQLLYIGGGAVWGTVDQAAYEHGLATVAGTVSHTGVGGLILGGGYGWLTGQHGLALDNVVQLTVVLASGETVIASPTSHPELLWGCKGAGCNFGVVTEFVMKAHLQRAHVFFTRLVFPMEKLETVVDAIEKWFKTSVPEERVSWACFRMPPEFKPALTIMYFFNGTAQEGRKHAKTLYDAGPIKEIASEELPYVKLNTLTDAALGPGGRKYCKGKTIPKLTYEIANQIISRLGDAVASDPRLQNCGTIFEYTNKTAIMKHTSESAAFANRTFAIENLSYIFYDDPSLDDTVRETVRGMFDFKVDELPGYTNYDPTPEKSHAAKRAFGSNYERLRKVKRRYDPDQVFNKWFPIEPASEDGV